MASVFRRSKKKNTPYTIQYTDHDGERRTVKGFTDKGLSEQLAAKLEAEARLRRMGLVDPVQERFVQTLQSDIEPHLVAFEDSLTDNSPKHVTLTMSRVRRVIEGCESLKLADIEAEAVVTWLRSIRRSEGIGHRTYNHYVQAINSFCNWCVSTKRLRSNPLVGIDRLNPETDVRHQRRALTADEAQRLIASARSSGVSIQCFNGETRARIYILSYMTGLRRNELASLSPRSFSLDTVVPTLTVEARSSKHRKKDVLPLHLELVPMVRDWIAGKSLSEKLFPNLAKRRTWLMVKKDLERVGIPYETEEGIADFHAAGRHTHITELLRNGATLPEAQKLARHSDIKMTMKYTHIGLDDQAKALANLPTSALHGRCISGGVDWQRLTTDGIKPSAGNEETPDIVRGSVVCCHPLSQGVNMETAGIEPASCCPSVMASTCVSG
jgi:integrase